MSLPTYTTRSPQAASDAVCGFLPASVSSPVSNPAATMAKRPPPDPRTGAGVHTRALIEALPSTVTFQVRQSVSL